MVAEETLVAKNYNRLRDAGLTDDQVEAIMEGIATESDAISTKIRTQLGNIANDIRPLLLKLVESRISDATAEIYGEFRVHLTELEDERIAVDRRMKLVEQKIETIRRSQPIPPSKLYFDEDASPRPRRRLGRYVLGGIAVAVLGPIGLSLLAVGLKAVLGLLLHLLS